MSGFSPTNRRKAVMTCSPLSLCCLRPPWIARGAMTPRPPPLFPSQTIPCPTSGGLKAPAAITVTKRAPPKAWRRSPVNRGARCRVRDSRLERIWKTYEAPLVHAHSIMDCVEERTDEAEAGAGADDRRGGARIREGEIPEADGLRRPRRAGRASRSGRRRRHESGALEGRIRQGPGVA